MMKKLLVSLLALVAILTFVATVSAQSIGTINLVEVDGVDLDSSNAAITVGDSIRVRVEFTADVNTSEVTIEAELDGNRKNIKAETSLFDIEDGRTYTRTLILDVPFDLKDELSDDFDLTVEVSGDDSDKASETFTLRVQRKSYSADILGLSVPQRIKAGDLIPVDVALKNIGYNNLDDVFVTAKISALGIERTAFFGDIVSLECDDDFDSVKNYGIDVPPRKCDEDNSDTVTGRIFLEVPYGVKEGIYTLDVMVENDDSVTSQTAQVSISNTFSSGNFIVSGNQLLIVNPTNEVVVYRLIPESTSAVSVSVSESLVSVPAGLTRTVTVDGTSNAGGTQTYAVNVFSVDGKLVDTVTFTTTSEGKSTTSPIVVLTIILAIVFIVLLVVLIVLIGRKPEKEEFGESYY